MTEKMGVLQPGLEFKRNDFLGGINYLPPSGLLEH
jgi:hypothetical protein